MQRVLAEKDRVGNFFSVLKGSVTQPNSQGTKFGQLGTAQ
jgi:hypothetical protein